jgi:hypothetical protein
MDSRRKSGNFQNFQFGLLNRGNCGFDRGDGDPDPSKIIGRQLQDGDLVFSKVLLVANVLIAVMNRSYLAVAWRNNSPLVIPAHPQL